MPLGTVGQLRALTVGSIALISLIAFEALAVATVMPSVAAALGGLTWYALGFGAPLATSVVGMAVAGAWADAAGARGPLLSGIALFCCGLMIAGTAAQMGVFVGGRAVQGLGAGLMVVSLYALVGAAVPQERQPRLFAYFSAAWVVAATVGPLISGLTLRAIGWRPVFWLVALVAAPVVGVLWPALRGTSSGVSAPVDADDADGAEQPGVPPAQVRRRVLLAVGAGVAAAALQVAGGAGAGSASAGPAAPAVAVAALLVVAGCTLRLLPAGTFRLRRGLPSVIAVRALIGSGFAAAEAFLPLLLVRERGWPPTLAGATLTVGAVGWATSSWLQGRISDVEARYRLMRIGTALLVAGVAVCVLAAAPGTSPVLVVVGWACGGSGMGLAYPSTAILALHLAPPQRQGETSSGLTMGEALASAVALALAGAAFAALLPPAVSAVSSPAADAAPAGGGPYLAALSVAATAAVLSVLAARRSAPPRSG